MGGRGADDGARPSVIVLLPEGAVSDGAVVPLDAHEAHHLRVRRAEAGERIDLRNGAGLVGSGVIERASDGYAVRVVESRAVPPPPTLSLIVGAGDRDRFTWLVEKAAELGVTDVTPLETAYTAGVATRIRATHLEKLARRALEATKQSGAPWAPRLHPPLALAELLARPEPGTRWLADARGAHPTGPEPGPLTVLIGPEAGLRDDERAAVLDAGWLPVRLGAHVLRFETAAVAAAAVAGILNGMEG